MFGVDFVKRLIYAWSITFIVWVGSEYFLPNEPSTMAVLNMQNSLIELFIHFLEFSLYYGLSIYIFLLAVVYFNVNNVWSLILAGALYAWSVEGLYIHYMTIGIPLPFGIIWPTIPWHAFIEVVIMWYLMFKILEKSNMLKTSLASIGLGAFWGLAASWWWIDGTQKTIEYASHVNDEILTAPAKLGVAEMSFLFVMASIVLLLGYLIFKYAKSWDFKPTKFEYWGVGIIFAFYTIVGVFVTFGLNLIILLLYYVTFLALKRYKKSNTSGKNILDNFKEKKIKLVQLIPLILIPITAILVYSFLHGLSNFTFEIITFVFVPITFVSLIFLFIAYWKCFRAKAH